ncbi:MAG: hypothetical protein HGA43_13135 [Nitrospirae bacterium]|nr:hypothetical protein [Nitrospirota bacterium]
MKRRPRTNELSPRPSGLFMRSDGKAGNVMHKLFNGSSPASPAFPRNGKVA